MGHGRHAAGSGRGCSAGRAVGLCPSQPALAGGAANFSREPGEKKGCGLRRRVAGLEPNEPCCRAKISWRRSGQNGRCVRLWRQQRGVSTFKRTKESAGNRFAARTFLAGSNQGTAIRCRSGCGSIGAQSFVIGTRLRRISDSLHGFARLVHPPQGDAATKPRQHAHWPVLSGCLPPFAAVGDDAQLTKTDGRPCRHLFH